MKRFALTLAALVSLSVSQFAVAANIQVRDLTSTADNHYLTVDMATQQVVLNFDADAGVDQWQFFHIGNGLFQLMSDSLDLQGAQVGMNQMDGSLVADYSTEPLVFERITNSNGKVQYRVVSAGLGEGMYLNADELTGKVSLTADQGLTFVEK